MAPKSLLRHPMAISNFEEMGPGTSFNPVIPDLSVKPGNVKKVLLCTGKVYYDLIVERQERQLEAKIAIIRIEQLCPFPYHLFAAEMAKYPRAKVRNFRLQDWEIIPDNNVLVELIFNSRITFRT